MVRFDLGAWTRFCVDHRVGVWVVTLFVTVILALGVPRIAFEEDPFDALPVGSPHAAAADHIIAEFPGNAFASPVFVSVSPDKWRIADTQLPNRAPPAASQDALAALISGQGQAVAATHPGPLNITDEVYMRGMEEMFQFIEARVPEVTWGITLPAAMKLVNYTNTGVPGLRAPDVAAFSMPATDPEGAAQFQAAWSTFYASNLDAVRAIVSADWQSARSVVLLDPQGRSLSDMGGEVYAAVDAYRDEVRACDAGGPCGLAWNVFDPDDIIVDPRGAPAASHHLSRTTGEDLLRLGPWVALFIAASLLVAFRRPSTVIALLVPLAMSSLATLGALGWLDVPVHSVSLLVFPILLGNGIDFGIHLASAYHGARGLGQSQRMAAATAGRHAGIPLMLATITTVAGVALLIFAPNRMLAQLGLAIIIGMTLLLATSLTALPAGLSWTRSPRTGLGETAWLQRVAGALRRRRVVGLAVVAVLLLASVPAWGGLQTFVMGTPAADFPPGDAQREDFDASNTRYFVDDEDLVSNVLVLEGDLTTPAAMELMARLEEAMGRLSFVREESVTSLRFAMQAWLQVREGTAGAPAIIAQESIQPGSTFPQDQERIRAVIDEMFETPLATYASFFVDGPEYRVGTVLVEIRQAPDMEQLSRDWHTLLRTIDEVTASVQGHDIQVHVAGQTAVSYLFTAEELPYLGTAAMAGPLLTGGLVWALRRRLRDAVIVAAVITVTGAWWLAALSWMHIPLSIALVVPVVVITAIGSDYALHLCHARNHQGGRAWRTVGRAVLYSAFTDLGAFLIFTRMRYGVLQDAAWATVAALVCAVLATLLVVPLLEPSPDAAGRRAPVSADSFDMNAAAGT